MGDNVTGAENQQERPDIGHQTSDVGYPESSETTRHAPLTRKASISYLNGAAHDATLNKRKRIRFSQHGKEWLEVLQDILLHIGCNSWTYKEGKGRDIYVLETLCKDITFKYLPSSREEKIFYLKGFFDAEGGVPHNGKRFYIQLTQKDKKKMEFLKRCLEEFGIMCGKVHNPSKRINPDYWRIYISANSWGKFAERIGSYHPVRNEILRERVKI